jgi:hypothetical protein
MLLGRETESRIMSVLRALGSAFSAYTIGRGLGQTVPTAIQSAISTSRMTVLEQSFMAGKVASLLGPNALKTMNKDQIAQWVYTNNVTLTDREKAQLAQMRNDTERWLESRTDAVQSKYRTAIANADRDWRSALARGTFLDAEARSVARSSALGELVAALTGETESFSSQIDRLLQTELHSYFQQGQIQASDEDELVYKIPRAAACDYCLDLHVNGDGSPRMYRLADVLGNSNWGVPAYAWQFTIGPVHPHCYCILYLASQNEPRGNDSLREVMEERMTKSLDRKSSIVPTTNTFDMLKSHGHGEEIPAHELKLISAIRQLYGPDPPC